MRSSETKDENGNIILDQKSSLVLTNQNSAELTKITSTVEHSPSNNHFTGVSFKKSELYMKWSAEKTDNFFGTLRTIGTDSSFLKTISPIVVGANSN